MTLRQKLRATAALFAPATVGLVAAIGIAGSASAQTTPSGQDFVNAAADTANWILPHKSYTGNNYTPAAQITPANVRNLRLAWKYTADDTGPMEVSPIVYNGIMYITTAHDHVAALNAATGKPIWSFTDDPHVISFAANRGVALFDGNVYFGTLDGHLIALNAKTGQKVWDKVAVDDTANSFYTMSPVPYHDPETNRDMIIMGVSDGDWGGNGNIAAYNPQNGAVIWRWDTVPGPGEPGHDTWSGDSWKRGGAAAWTGVTIDSATHTMYLDLGNPSPDFLGSVRKGTNLYTDSMVALDISGAKPKLKWYHQFIPHDTHDWDPPMQPVLFTGEVNGQSRKLLAAGDKAGNLWIVDAETGKLVDHTAVSFQKGQNTQPTLEGNIACPNTLGGVEYQGGAYDPATNNFYVSSENECGFWKASKDAVYIAGEFYLGGAFPKLVGPDTGQVNAVNVSNGVFSWRHHFNLPNYGGALVTASGLVFSGNLGGNEHAFDAKTGNILWSYDTGGYIQAPTEAFEVNGKEYVVVASGEAGNAKIPELPTNPPRPNTINVFSVP
ncbi:MAG TPA: PQQ-binding-like beta-propeller repeat protein [Acetobacteraceae bacterium]|jgi:alcohol dehydrogenase (cytochrome c)